MPVSDEVLMQRFKLLLFSIVWIGCVIGLIISVEYTRAFLNEAVEAPGRVVALNAGGSHPQIEYTNLRGERVSYPQGGLIFGFRVGDKATVLYLENSPNPQETIDKFGAIWESSIAFAFFVTGFPLIAFGKKIGSKLKTRKESEKWKITD